MAPVRLQVYSDYLCPWCHLADHRLGILAEELAGELEVEWRSYLLRPRAGPPRDLESFTRYTRSWLKPSSEPDAPRYRVWSSAEGPPSHSLPPQVAAKAAARLGDEAFSRLHRRLLRAYFEESRDITRTETLQELWRDAGLPVEALGTLEDPELAAAVLREHAEAVELGITGVPAMQPAGSDFFVLGAQPLETLRRWLRRLESGGERGGER